MSFCPHHRNNISGRQGRFFGPEGRPSLTGDWVLAAVIVGGTSLAGGSGSVWGTLVGVVFIGVVVNGMRLLDIHEDGQLIARGVIVAIAVLLSRFQEARSSGS